MTLNAATDPSLPSLRDRAAIDDERLSTVALLHDVANDPRFAIRRHELKALASAVRRGGSREAVWRGVNLQEAFSPQSTIRLPPRRRRRLAGVLGVLAALALFLPVVWTVWSFRQAVAAYQQVLETGAVAGASLLQLWTTGFGGALSERYWLPEVAQGSATPIVWGILLIAGQRLLSRSADKADDDDVQQGAAQLAQAMNCASITINSRTVQDSIQGLDVLTEASAELLRVHQATRHSLQLLQGVAQRLEDSSGSLARGASAMGKSLGQHTGALQHQISELTQIRASLERLSGLVHFEDAVALRTPQG